MTLILLIVYLVLSCSDLPQHSVDTQKSHESNVKSFA